MRILVRAFADGARHADHKLAPQLVGLLAERRVEGFVKHQLRDAVAVAQVDERHAAHLSGTLYPSGQRRGPSLVGQSQLAASICPVHINMMCNDCLWISGAKDKSAWESHSESESAQVRKLPFTLWR